MSESYNRRITVLESMLSLVDTPMSSAETDYWPEEAARKGSPAKPNGLSSLFKNTNSNNGEVHHIARGFNIQCV